MKKGVSLPEISIALLIIVISLVVFLTLASNYLRTVKNASELFIMNSLAQEGLELAIAWRNKQIEAPFGSTTLVHLQLMVTIVYLLVVIISIYNHRLLLVKFLF
jgi:Tfp pilus assembly protein PilV